VFVIVPHVGKSHLTYQTLGSIPDTHRVILVDASYVADMDCYADLHRATVRYVRPKEIPTCLARNWNLGAAEVPASEPYWMFCASDVQFYAESWRRIEDTLRLYPDAGIIRDAGTNWNVWIVRRWAWDILEPMDERYKPCGGEDDDLVMKCHAAGIRIRAPRIGVNQLEGGHATRLDIRRELAGTSWDGRRDNIEVFREKWACTPSIGRDPVYGAAHRAIHIDERRSAPPAAGSWTMPKGKPKPPVPLSERVPDAKRLHFGCGKRRLEGFLNIDRDPVSGCEYRMDAANDPWPWKPGTIERIEAYHFIEHLSEAEGREFMRRCHEALQPGGVLVLECPDLAALCETYPASRRMTRRRIFGFCEPRPMRHQWGYCGPTMDMALRDDGFERFAISDGTDDHVEECKCLRAEATR
jgi:hypothetical protein